LHLLRLLLDSTVSLASRRPLLPCWQRRSLLPLLLLHSRRQWQLLQPLCACPNTTKTSTSSSS
jgi:hypothetical protein